EIARLGPSSYALPAAHIRDTALEHLSVEEVYARVRERAEEVATRAPSDLLDGDPAAPSGAGAASLTPSAADTARRADELRAYWRQALQQALPHARDQGALPAGLARELDTLRARRVNWRAALWRFLVMTPSDYGEFDRRFVWRGLYLEELAAEEARVYVAV